MNYLSIFNPLLVHICGLYIHLKCKVYYYYQNMEVLSMSSIDPIEMGERIKKQRQLNGFSREKLAELANITPRFCYDIELGAKNMSLSTLSKISASLHVSADYILFGPSSHNDIYAPLIGMIETCPSDKLEHLEQIVSHYMQAIQDTTSK